MPTIRHHLIANHAFSLASSRHVNTLRAAVMDGQECGQLLRTITAHILHNFFYVKAARFLSQDHLTHRAHLTAPSISTMTINIYCCVHVGTTGAICEFCKVESVQNKNAPSESRVLKSVRIDEII